MLQRARSLIALAHLLRQANLSDLRPFHELMPKLQAMMGETSMGVGWTHGRRLSGIWLAGGLVAIGSIVAVLLAAAIVVNSISQRWEEDQLRSGLTSRLAELEASVVPQVDWDDAVANLDHNYNPTWVSANIGAFLTQTAGFDRVYVVSADGAWRYSQQGATSLRPRVEKDTHAAAASLIADVRRTESARGPFRKAGPSSSMISKPIQASAITRLDGAPWILTASLVQPDFGTNLPNAKAPVVITARAIDARFVAELAKRYQLSGARLALEPRGELAAVQLLDAQHKRVAVLTWTPRRPGAALLKVVALPLVFALALVGLAIVVLQRSSMRILRDLLKTQDDLRDAAQRAQSADRAKSDFLANVSHEIRTPLNGVVGVAELLAATDLRPEQRDLVETIRASGKTLDRLLMDVLDISKIEAGGLSVCQEAFNLGAELQSVIALWRPKASERGLELSCDLDRVEATVIGDTVRLRQILSNLLSNAVKFTEAGRVSLTAVRDGERCVIKVADTGIGFDAEAKKRLFSRFEQADSSITRRFGGTGLGLAISRNLAQLMGGTLDCISEPGRGTTFTLDLPLPSAPVAATVRQIEPRVVGSRLRVLAADDHGINRKVVKLAMEALGADVALAVDGAEALALFEAGDYDLVLMDMQMPVMDGVAATQAIRRLEADGARRRTPIIMLTANAGDEHAALAAEIGADGHVAKPLKPDILLRAIEQISLLPVAA